MNICIKWHCFHIFVLIHAFEQTTLNFLILGKSKFPPKSFITHDNREEISKILISKKVFVIDQHWILSAMVGHDRLMKVI